MSAADQKPNDHRVLNSLAQELAVPRSQVVAAVGLLDEGATVPFIARYRKEVTGGLDDTQLRLLAERLVYLRELEERRAAIIASIDEQGKLTAELAQSIDAAEDQTAAGGSLPALQAQTPHARQIAREAGLEPLADALLGNPDLDPQHEALAFLRGPDAEGQGAVADAKAAALDGARDILSGADSPNAPTCSMRCAICFGRRAGSIARWSKKSAARPSSSAIISTTPSP